HPFNLGDKGFISSELQKKLYEAYQIAFWTPSRKNQKHRPSESWEKWLKQKRKVIERCSLSSLTSIVSQKFVRIRLRDLKWH
ncbi:transposase, IS982 family, partial [Anoxybacillus flavithermus TNO-09.006]